MKYTANRKKCPQCGFRRGNKKERAAQTKCPQCGLQMFRTGAQKKTVASILRKKSTRAERKLFNAISKTDWGYDAVCQKPILDFFADIYIKRFDLVIEVDGSSHEGREDYDRWRDSRLKNKGLRVIRIQNEQVMDELPATLEFIKSQILGELADYYYSRLQELGFSPTDSLGSQ